MTEEERKELEAAVEAFGRVTTEEKVDGAVKEIFLESMSILFDSVRVEGKGVDFKPSAGILENLAIAEAKLDGRLGRAKAIRGVLEKGVSAAFSIAFEHAMGLL